jgi:hypothetical protein
MKGAANGKMVEKHYSKSYRSPPHGVNFTNILRLFRTKVSCKAFFVLEVKVKLFIGARKLAQLRL